MNSDRQAPNLKIAFTFPGQGEQQHIPDTTAKLLELDPVSIDTYQRAARILKMDIPELCLRGTKEELSNPNNLQPATVVTSAAVYESLIRKGITPDMVFGHSLGEYPALFAAGSISFEAMCKLVAARAKYMEAADADNPGSMAALVWHTEDNRLETLKIKLRHLKQICRESGAELAASNSFATRTISGSKAAVNRAKEIYEELINHPDVQSIKGRLRWVESDIPYGAHRQAMKPAGLQIAKDLEETSVQTPLIPTISNRTGRYFASPQQIKSDLVYQMSGPVKYDKSVKFAVKEGAGIFVEAGPGKVLSGLNKQMLGATVQIFTTAEYFNSLRSGSNLILQE